MSFSPTVQQRKLYEFICAEIAEKGVAPTVREMGAHLGSGVSNTHRLLTGLEARGLIRRISASARAIEIVGRAAPTLVAEEALRRVGAGVTPQNIERVASALSLSLHGGPQ